MLDVPAVGGPMQCLLPGAAATAGPQFLNWEAAYTAGPAAVGGKGWNLARLARYGFDVPAGGVLPVAACRQFLVGGDLFEAARQASPDNESGLEALRRRILAAPLPAGIEAAIAKALAVAGGRPIAVRSSAVDEDSDAASFAGIHTSCLNVLDAAGAAQAVRTCYASLFTPAALVYRRRLGLPGPEAGMAVVLMAMAEARAAGVAFSCDPAAGRTDLVLINANQGLGESVVSGQCDPDEYRVLRHPIPPRLRIAEVRIGRREQVVEPAPAGGTVTRPATPSRSSVLPEAAILELARLVMRIKSALGGDEVHQDVEWAWDGERFAVLQSRPVTGMRRYPYPPDGGPEIWANANTRDAVPMVVSPLGRSDADVLIDAMLMVGPRLAGIPVPVGLPLTKLHRGRLYLNLGALQRYTWDTYGLPPENINRLMGGHQPTVAVPPHSAWKSLGILLRTLRFGSMIKRMRARADELFARNREIVEQRLAVDMPKLSDSELADYLIEARRIFTESEQIHMLNSGGAMSATFLERLVRPHAGARTEAVLGTLLCGHGGIVSAEHAIRLVKLAAVARGDAAAYVFLTQEPFEPRQWQSLPVDSPFRQGFAQFLADFGHRGVYEVEASQPRWQEDPGYPLGVVRQHLAGAAHNPATTAAAARRRAADELKKLPFWLRRIAPKLAAEAARETAQREAAKSEMVRCIGILRQACLEAGRRWVGRGWFEAADDAFLLCLDEILARLASGQGKGVRELVADARAEAAALAREAPPDILADGKPRVAAPAFAADGEGLIGLPVAPGVATGIARQVLHPDQFNRLQKGDVLVAPSTDPAWTPLFLRASALVCETGGYLSHGATVAREFGLPAVVNVAGALAHLRDGVEVTVDGERGRVAQPR